MHVSSACSSCINMPTDYMQAKLKPRILVAPFIEPSCCAGWIVNPPRTKWRLLSQEGQAEAILWPSSPHYWKLSLLSSGGRNVARFEILFIFFPAPLSCTLLRRGLVFVIRLLHHMMVTKRPKVAQKNQNNCVCIQIIFIMWGNKNVGLPTVNFRLLGVQNRTLPVINVRVKQ